MSASARGAGLAVGVVTLVVAVLVGTGTGSETTVFRARRAPAASACRQFGVRRLPVYQA